MALPKACCCSQSSSSCCSSWLAGLGTHPPPQAPSLHRTEAGGAGRVRARVSWRLDRETGTGWLLFPFSSGKTRVLSSHLRAIHLRAAEATSSLGYSPPPAPPHCMAATKPGSPHSILSPLLLPPEHPWGRKQPSQLLVLVTGRPEREQDILYPVL